MTDGLRICHVFPILYQCVTPIGDRCDGMTAETWPNHSCAARATRKPPFTYQPVISVTFLKKYNKNNALNADRGEAHLSFICQYLSFLGGAVARSTKPIAQPASAGGDFRARTRPKMMTEAVVSWQAAGPAFSYRWNRAASVLVRRPAPPASGQIPA